MQPRLALCPKEAAEARSAWARKRPFALDAENHVWNRAPAHAWAHSGRFWTGAAAMTKNTRPRPECYAPLALAPEKAQARLGKTADRTHREPMAASKLMCLGCVGWEYAEAKRCEINTCALWALNRRIFSKDDADSGAVGG